MARQVARKRKMQKLREKKTRQTKEESVGKELWFPKGCHLAVRAEEGSKFYLCRLQQNVFNCTKEANIRWLSDVRTDPTVYRISYVDKIDPVSILMQVELNQQSKFRYKLTADQQHQIDEMVRLAEDVQSGNVSLQDVGDDVEEIQQIEEPPKKKRKLSKSEVTEVAQKKSSPPGKGKKKMQAKDPNGNDLKRKVPKKKDDELELHPRPDIKVLVKDPLFESRLPMPFVSKVANSKLVFRAINLGDAQMLEELLEDGSKIKTLYNKSPDNPISPLEAMERMPNKGVLAVLCEEYFGKKFKKRIVNNQDDRQYLTKLNTNSLKGSSSRDSGKDKKHMEGNNVFLKTEIYKWTSVKERLDPKTFDKLRDYSQNNKTLTLKSRYGPTHIVPLIMKGHNKMAGQAMEAVDASCWNLNFLMSEVLLKETKDLTKFTKADVEQCSELCDLTALHCAAVNPNSKYLKQLLSVNPNDQVLDRRGRQLLHYAASCSSPANIELLLERGADMFDTTFYSLETPLHCAIAAKRVNNVKLLVKTTSKGKTNNSEIEKYGPGGVNQPMKYGLTPLHLAVESEQMDVARILLSHGASVNAVTSPSNFQRTALQMAAQTGNLDMVKLLVDHGAVVEQKESMTQAGESLRDAIALPSVVKTMTKSRIGSEKPLWFVALCFPGNQNGPSQHFLSTDRLGQTAVHHACKNGATKVLSYLLHIGANPNRADNSGNTALHCAAAYGWYFTLKLLLDAGVDLNPVNRSKVTPLTVAYMKGHVGIVKELLQHDLDQATGMSMLFLTCESDLTQEDLYTNIQLLVKRNSDICNMKDHDGKNPLFYLARGVIGDPNKEKEGFAQSVRIAKLLLDNGCDVNAVDKNGFTALMEVLGKCSNTPLADFLVKKGCKVLAPSAGDERKLTLLHKLNERFVEGHSGLPNVVKTLTKKYLKQMKSMAKSYDTDGYTPLLDVCSKLDSQKSREKFCKNENIFLDYMDLLVKTLPSDVNAVVKKKVFPPGIWPAEDSNKWYRMKYHENHTPLMLLIRDLCSDEDSFGSSEESKIMKMIRLLVENGALNCEDLTVFTMCIHRGNTKLLSYLGNQKRPEVSIDVDYKEVKYDVEQLLSVLDFGCNLIVKGKKGHSTFLHKFLTEVRKKKDDYQTVGLKLIEKLEARQNGFDFNEQDRRGRNPLHYATRANLGYSMAWDVEKKLFQLGSEVGLQDKKGRTPLHYAVKHRTQLSERNYRKVNRRRDGDEPLDLVKFLCEKMTGEEINARDRDGKTALHMAAEAGAVNSCKHLLSLGDKKSDLFLYDLDGNSALSLAILNHRTSCAEVLIEQGANLQDFVVKLTDQEKKLRKKLRKSSAGNDKIRVKALDDCKDAVPSTWIIESARQHLNEERLQPIPLCKVAIENKLYKVQEVILKADKSRTGLTQGDIAEIALEVGNYCFASSVLKYDLSETHLLKINKNGRNFLHLLALSCEKKPTFDRLKSKEERRKASLHFWIKRRSSDDDEQTFDLNIYEIAQFLIEKKVSLDDADEFGFYPIHYAIINRHFKLAHLFSEHSNSFDEDPDGKNVRYLEAILWRIYSMNFDDRTWDFLETLLDKGMNVNQHINLPVYPDLVKCYPRELRKDPDFTERQSAKPTTALIAAIRCTFFPSELALKLLQHKADPNVPDGDQVTPLMHAVMQNNVEFVKLLFNQHHSKPESSDCKNDSTDCESDSSDEESKTPTKIEDLKPVQNMSGVNLNAQDKNGRTALHYVASPSADGTFDNAHMASLLVNAGALELQDKSGLTPYSLALRTGAHRVADMLKSLGHGTQERFIPPHHDESFHVNDGISVGNADKPDFYSDAEKVVQEVSPGMEVDHAYIHKLDDSCSVLDGVLMKDEDLDVWYDALLTKVYASATSWDVYKYYKIQLIHQPRPCLYIVYTVWGNTGQTGKQTKQYQHVPFNDQQQAVQEFHRIFKEKTRNEWTAVKNFEAKPKKYRLLEDRERLDPPEMKGVEIDLDTSVSSTLPHHLLSIIQKTMDPKSLNKAMMEVRDIITKYLPFGQLHRERLTKAKQVLDEIMKNSILAIQFRSRRKTMPNYKDYYKKIAKLCNEYFYLVPDSSCPRENSFPFYDRDKLYRHLKCVENMLEYQVATEVFLGAMACKQKIHPADYVYRCLDSQLELMQPGDPMAQLILKNISLDLVTEREEYEVTAIYKVSRSGDEERVQNSQLENRCLLWHGVKTNNLLSALCHGLKPRTLRVRNRQCAGHYLQLISFSKNFGTAVHQSDGFILLCEVALGQPDYMKEMSYDKMVEAGDCNTFIVQNGNLDKEFDWLRMPSGLSMALSHDDRVPIQQIRYLIRDPAQVCLRHLVKYRTIGDK